jgi:long-chain fatty acid transport protein
MKQKKLLAGALCVAASLAAQTVLGAGFGIYEGSARGNAMGTEVTADPASPSVLYNNPAAMTGLEGTQFEAGVSLINPSVTVSTLVAPGVTIETDVEDNWWTPPSAYVTHQYNDKVWMGFGVFSRFGLGVEYPDDWPGRYNVQEATIQSLDLNPSIAVKVLDNLSLAVGLRAQWFDFELFKALPTGEPGVDPDLQLHIAGDNWGSATISAPISRPPNGCPLAFPTTAKSTRKSKATTPCVRRSGWPVPAAAVATSRRPPSCAPAPRPRPRTS